VSVFGAPTEGQARGGRYVVAVGAGAYTDEALPELSGVPTDISTVLNALGGLRHRAYESAVFPDGLVDPVLPSDVLGPLGDWLADDPAGRGEDTVIVYYSGHGVTADRLYLAVKDSRPLNPAGNAIAVDDLIRCFYQGGGTRLLLIVDTCYAALGGIDAMRTTASEDSRSRTQSELAQLRESFEAKVRTAARNAAHELSGAPGASQRDVISYAVITAARGQAQDSAFSAAFANALAPRTANGAYAPAIIGHLQPYLRVQDIVDRINADFAARQLIQRASAHIGIYSGAGPGPDAAEDFLPNPDYRPDLPEGLDRAEQQMWISGPAREFFTRRGTASDGDAATHTPIDQFRGRGSVLSEIVTWLRAPASETVPQVTLVTGSSGIGKSAVLGRLVTRADPNTRHLIPDAALTVAADLSTGTFGLVIHARHTSLNQVTDDFARALGLPPDQEIDSLAQAIDERPESAPPLTVVIDALDEAGSATGGKDPQSQSGLIADYLSNLITRTPRLRLLIGTRPHLLDRFDSLGDRKRRVINLDEERWTTYDDLASYAAYLLQHPHGPGSTTAYTTSTAHHVGGEIAARACPNYLITRLTARALANRPTPSPETWEDFPPAGSPDAVITAFRWALATQLGDAHPHIRDLLRPLAFAEGAGMPASIWPAIAAAFVGRPVPDSDLADAISSQAAGPYVVETLDDEDRSVFRLYHQALAEDLRSDAPSDTQRRIADALGKSVPLAKDGQRDWLAADPYVRRHLSKHADLAGKIDTFLSDPKFPRDDVCPYPGLTAFRQEDAAFFFGRGPLVASALAQMDERARSGGALAIVGPSGSGKTSLLFAGILPAIQRGALPLPASKRWPQIMITPTARPLTTLAEALAKATGAPSRYLAEVAHDPAACAGAVRRLLGDQNGHGQSGQLLLVVDQLEEIFTLCEDEEERELFLDLLTGLAARGPHDAHPAAALVVIALRADFYVEFLSFPQMQEVLGHRHVVVGPMSESEVREAILHPASTVGLELEPGLPELLLRDMGETTHGDFAYRAGQRLPLLAHALRSTWQQRRNGMLTVHGYTATGGVDRVIAASAEQVYSSFDSPGQAAARALFLRLIRIGDDHGDTRRRLPRTTLLGATDDATAMKLVIEAFTRSGLLTVADSGVEISHEALLYAWPRMREWISMSRADHLMWQMIEEDADSWLLCHRDPAWLYTGSRLEGVQTQIDVSGASRLSANASEFLATSIRYRIRARRYRRLQAAMMTVLAAISAAAAVARLAGR